MKKITKPQPNSYVQRTIQRDNGTKRVIYDFSQCTSLVDYSQANTNNINHLVKKFTPDEFALYLATKNNNKPITGHDFSKEPDMQSAMNEVYRLKQAYLEVPENIRSQFPNITEFLKFVDDPKNSKTLIELGLTNIVKPKIEVEKIQKVQIINDEPNDENKTTKKQKTTSNQTPNS